MKNMLALSQERFLGSQVYLRGSKSGGCGLDHGSCARLAPSGQSTDSLGICSSFVG